MGFHGRVIVAVTLVAAFIAIATVGASASLLVKEQLRGVDETSLVLAHGLALQVGRLLDEGGGRALEQAAEGESALRTQIEALVGYSKTILYVAVADARGIAVLHSNPAGRGAPLETLQPLDAFAQRNPLFQLLRLVRDDMAFGVELPIRSERQPSGGHVRVAVSLPLLRHELLGTILMQALIAAVVVLCAFIGSMFVASRALAPLDRLREELSRIDTGEGQRRLDLRSVEDVERLSRFFATVGRSLAERRSGTAGEEQRLADLSRMTSAVVHQLRNPLNAMVLTIATLRERLDGEAHRQLDALDREVRRADEVIQGFLKLTRLNELVPEPIRPDSLVEEVLERWTPRAAAAGVRIDFAASGDLPALAGNRELLGEALGNLLANALDVTPQGGTIVVTADRHTPGGVVLRVRDSGPGIAEALLPRLFDLYFTTKPDGNGIGLPLVKRVAELHGGDVQIESTEGNGTTVSLRLPRGEA